MSKHIFSIIFLFSGFFSINVVASVADSTVPEPFQGFDPNSGLTINYVDLDSLLDAVVLDTGRSTRQKANPSHAKTGTRMKVKVNRATVNEGNRFYYEIFLNNEGNQQTLRKIRTRLENIPELAPLEKFSRDEQLAYWINLYNVTLLDEIVKVYPERELEERLVGKKSILAEKILTVSGVPLSLNDIQFTILKQNYGSNPLLIYGLYQGIIGGPNIRKQAYTGKYVYGDLIDNAVEFVNSNRGTEYKSKRAFRVSSLYARNAVFFADFDSDLTRHLLAYLEGEERSGLQAATKIKPDISDWTITDLYGTYRDMAGSISNNSAALMGAASGAESSRFASKAARPSRYSPAVTKYLNELNEKQATARAETGVVTIEELGQVSDETDAADEDNRVNN